MATNLDVMRTLMDAWKRRDVEAFLALLTDDFEYYWHIDTKPLQGKEKMRKFLGNYSTAYEQREWRVIHHAEAGNLLLLEGYEELY
ncbi:MAG: nuclear transport factor 2 family protein, partial [Rhodospirillaceae bacterium]|nr:nuclear transport factor 2 family protein [Rhodospirillaceae bacterium]